MKASKALKLSKKQWKEDWDEAMKYLNGWGDAVKFAATKGARSTVAAIVPEKYCYLVSNYFEELGYFVILSPDPQNEKTWMVRVDWGNKPTTSRAYKKSIEKDS